MIRLYIALFIITMVGGTGFGAYKYYVWSQETMNILRENNVKLEQAAITLQNTVEQMEANAQKNEELNRNLTQELQRSQVHLDALRSKFAKIDLTMEALSDPAGLEERVNNAVERLIQRIESETSPVVSTDDADGVSGQSIGTEGSNSD